MKYYIKSLLPLVLAEVMVKKFNMLIYRKCDVPNLGLARFVVQLIYHIVQFYDVVCNHI